MSRGSDPAEPDVSSALRTITDHLYVYEDSCLVYVLVDGEHALLIESGSGDVMDVLPGLGVKQVDWVLHTHHHRDGAAGDDRVAAAGARLAVPEREADLFERVEDYWAHLPIFDNYYLGSDSFSLSRHVPVAVRLADYATFTWRQYVFQVVPAPGHTQGSIAFLTEVDGVAVAFTGDLIASAGRLWQVHALQWQYGGGWGDAAGIQATALSLAEVLDAQPDLLLPTHGVIMSDAQSAVRELRDKLRALHQYLDGSSFVKHPAWLITDRHLSRLSEHLWMNGGSLANSYTLIFEDGSGLFLDYGYPSLSHFAARFRFTRHSLNELFGRAGLRKPDLFIPSHYHDDHIAGAPLLQREFGVKVWGHEVLTDILRHPAAYSLPCLLAEPLAVERDLRDGERFEWNGFQLEITHAPGHTYYASSLLMEVDGLRAVLTGDNLHEGTVGPLLGGPIYRNRYELGDFARSIEQLCEWKPDLLLTGHSGAIMLEPAWLERAWHRARELAGILTSLAYVPEEAGFALDPNWVQISPYQLEVLPGGQAEVSVRIINHSATLVTAKVAIIAPSGWTVEPGQGEVVMTSRQAGQYRFILGAPSDSASAGVHVICADVGLDDGTRMRHYGHIAEGLIRILDCAL